jgi:hypothetical protein
MQGDAGSRSYWLSRGGSVALCCHPEVRTTAVVAEKQCILQKQFNEVVILGRPPNHWWRLKAKNRCVTVSASVTAVRF